MPKPKAKMNLKNPGIILRKMKIHAPFLPFFLFILPIQWLSAQASSTPYDYNKVLDSLFELKAKSIILLEFTGSEQKYLEITYSEYPTENNTATEKSWTQRSTGKNQPVSLSLSIGRYKISAIDLNQNKDTLWLNSGVERILLTRSSKPLIIENTGFGLRYFFEGEKTENILMEKEATMAFSLLAIASELISKDDFPLEAAQWREISQKLEENPFIRSQLGGMRFSLLPSTHPLTARITEELNKQAEFFFIRFPELATVYEGTSTDAASLSYFSLQDIEKNYRQPLIADAQNELKSAEDRIQVRRSAEGLNLDAIAVGLTDFVIERAKEEFSIAFLGRMQQDFSATSEKIPATKITIRELQLLFPKTSSFFLTQADLSNYKSMLPMAREAFILDLQDIGLNIHRLLELPQYKNLQNTGEIYHLALFYDIASMAYQGVALDTLVNNVFLRLGQRANDLFREKNLALAKHQNDSIRQILKVQIEQISNNLDALGEKIIGKKFLLETYFANLQSVAESTGQVSVFREMYGNYLQVSAQNDERLYMWMARDRHEQMRNIKYHLDGRRYYEQWLRYPSLDLYERYFTTRPDSTQLIAAGIELSRNLVSPISGETDLPTFMVDYYRFLLDTEQKTKAADQTFQALSKEALQKQADSLSEEISEILEALDQEIKKWKDSRDSNRLEDDLFALEFLQQALRTEVQSLDKFSPGLSPKEMDQILKSKIEKVNLAISWMLERLNALGQKTATTSTLLPRLKKWLSPPETSLPAAEQEPTLLLDILVKKQEIKHLLTQMDTLFIPKLQKAYDQTLKMKKVAEMTTQLIHYLRFEGQETSRNPFLSPETFREILSQESKRNLFLGIAHQRLQNTFPNSNLLPRNVATVISKFVDIVYTAGVLRDSLRQINGRKLQFQEYFPYARLGMDLLNTLINNPLIEKDTIFKSLRKAPLITDQTLSMFENVQSKRYGNALLNLVELFALVSEANDTASMRWQFLRAELIRYGSFMAHVASAENAEQVKSALLAVALPPGSSRVKREDTFNLALNAYLGLSGGTETLNAPNLTKPRATSIGLSLPIGISASWKFNREQNMSYSVLFSILDLGAIAAFRLGDNAAEDLPELKFENLIAPGGFLLFNIPKSPFSFGFGGQHGPRARKITIDGIETRSSAWRWSIFAGIDVPIFHFATKK